MLNLREPYPPFSTTTFEALTLRGTLKANTHFQYHTKITPRIKGIPRYPTITHAHITHKEARDLTSLATN